MRMQLWRRLPHQWIEAGGLRALRWRDGMGSSYAAALMVLAVIVHRVDQDTGRTRLTYPELHEVTGLSRAKISAGLTALVDLGIITRPNRGRSEVHLLDFDAPTFAKFPAIGLYDARGRIEFFQRITLRSRVELDMLKLWFLFCSRRNWSTNIVDITYDTIERYSGIDRPSIRDAISLGIHHGLIVNERTEDLLSGRVRQAYRVRHIEPYRHAATTAVPEPVTPPF